MTFNCPDCHASLANAIGQECEHCGSWVLPILTKTPPKIKKVYAMRRTALKQVSPKQRNLLVSYRKSAALGRADQCDKCGCADGLTKHHPYGRSGQQDGLDCINLWIWLCHTCHDWVHTNSNEAYELGWLQPKYRNQTGTSKKPWTT